MADQAARDALKATFEQAEEAAVACFKNARISSNTRIHRYRKIEPGADKRLYPGETLRRHTDHGELDSVQMDFAAKNGRIRGKLLRLEIVTEDYDSVAPRHAVFLG